MLKSRLLNTIAALCVCFAAVPLPKSVGAAAPRSDWTQWRGPGRDGTSQERGLLQQWPAGGPKLLWQMNDIGDGYSTPAVVGTRIYLMSNRGMDNEFVQALSTQDGKPVWTTRVGNVGNPNQNPPYAKARSTPTVDGDLIYALGLGRRPRLPRNQDRQDSLAEEHPQRVRRPAGRMGLRGVASG